jgi:hypothetical protein
MFIWVLRLAIFSNLSSMCWPSALFYWSLQNHGNDKENQCDHNNILVNLSDNINRYTYIIKPVYKRHSRETWKCALYEQLPWCSRSTCRFCSGLISFVFLVMFETPFLQHLRFVYARRNYVTNKPVYKRHSRETWKCALYEQLPFTYRLLLYALFTSGKHTLNGFHSESHSTHKIKLFTFFIIIVAAKSYKLSQF